MGKMGTSRQRRPALKPAARTTIAVKGARVHNLKNISLEIPRDRLIVVTGLSGSGKSSLAFDTIYAEGQRRYMESLSSYAKRFVAQVTKPDVDFVFGLSPVISIEQKTLTSNPRSTVATMAEIGLDQSTIQNMDAVVDRFIVSRRHDKAIKAGIASTLLVGDGLMQLHVGKGASKAEAARFYGSVCSPAQHFVYGDIAPEYFVFNNPESACRTCGGLGVDKLTHPELLIPDPERSIAGGCFVREAFKYNPDTWDGRMMYSLSMALNFPLDLPWKDLPESARHAILYGIEPKKIPVRTPPDAKVRRDEHEGREVGFHGIARRIERHYRRSRQRGEASSRT